MVIYETFIKMPGKNLWIIRADVKKFHTHGTMKIL